MTLTKGLRIGPRDIAMLCEIGRYGLLSTRDAEDVYFDMKPNSVQKRLRLLSQNGLTRMVKLAVYFSCDDSDEKNRSKGGRIPALHALTADGADLIEQQTGTRPPRVLRSSPSAATFLHRREIVRVMRAFDKACDAVNLQRPRWVMEQDVWHAAPKDAPPNQRRLLYHQFPNGLTCQPDIACWLKINVTNLIFYFEVDLSTEGRKQIRRATKTDSYIALFNQRSWRRYWPELESPRPFVIWIAPTSRRVASLRECLRDQPIGEMCRFLEAKHLAKPANLLYSPVWETVTGERRQIYRPSPLSNP